MVGINLAGAEFGPGNRYMWDYIYPGEADLSFYSAAGMKEVRLPVSWERLQPVLGGPINETELGRLELFLDQADKYGMKVIVDIHNYARYNGTVIGSGDVTIEKFADFWRQLADRIGDKPAVYAYDLMNEPHNMPTVQTWPAAAQAAIDAIRTVDIKTKIIVEGDGWSTSGGWQKVNANLLMNDPADNIAYSAHVYFDKSEGGKYSKGYDAYDVTPQTGVELVKPFLDWLKANNVEGHIGEFGVPSDDPRWLVTMDNMLDVLDKAGVSADYWGGGPWWWGKYVLSPRAADGSAMPQMAVLTQHLDTGPVIDRDNLPSSGGLQATHDLVVAALGQLELAGGRGDDTYMVTQAGMKVIEAAGEGNDQVFAAVSFSLEGQAIETLTLTGTGQTSAIGNELVNTLVGNSAANVLDGKAGADTMRGSGGDDTYYVDNLGDQVIEANGFGYDRVLSSVSFSLAGQFAEELTLTGKANINATGNELANRLVGNAGANVLDGGAGADTMVGGAGADTYVVDNAGDVVVEDAKGGVDQIVASVTYSLVGLEVENLTLTGTRHLNATGNDGANRITGNAGDNVIDGLRGADFMAGGAGNDTYYVDNAGDRVAERPDEGTDLIVASVSVYMTTNGVENVTLVGTGDISVTANALANTLIGNDGNNVLNGGLGADIMIGGLGDDTYYVDNTGDRVTEEVGGGNDLVASTINFTLARTQVERLTLLGTANLKATGNDLDNRLVGNTGSNVIDGGLGADIMVGGLGDDTYYVDNIGDRVTELDNGGRDTVYASVDFFARNSQVEQIVLTGTAAIDATGNALDNALTGNAAANILDGGAGADILSGAAGDDTYFVDNVGDQVIEYRAGGYDKVFSSVGFAVGSMEIEEVQLTGNADINATGSSINNVLTGNSGNNVLNGGAGVDIMAGGRGDDTYYLDNVGDQVIEARNAGFDTVISSVSFAAGDQQVEAITLTGWNAINATGNALTNILTGNAVNNVLDGGTGADTMIGGGGNDTYYVDSMGDKVVERAGEGVDQVYATVSYSLAGTAAENLTLSGTGRVATGNELDNVLVGNGADNVIYGGLGNDRMTGGGGADEFVFDTALNARSNVDAITDFGGDDTIWLSRSIFGEAGAHEQLSDSAFVLGTAARDADDRILYDAAGGKLFFDADGVGGTAAVLFATVAPNTLLTAADFHGLG
jgi:Ca2+-binding RTX toxin-like protein